MNTLSNVTKESIRNIVKNQFFTVVFIKKDGTERIMNGRLQVVKHLRGGRSTTEHKNNLLTMYENNVGYRNINLDTLKELKVGGEIYKINS